MGFCPEVIEHNSVYDTKQALNGSQQDNLLHLNLFNSIPSLCNYTKHYISDLRCCLLIKYMSRGKKVHIIDLCFRLGKSHLLSLLLTFLLIVPLGSRSWLDDSGDDSKITLGPFTLSFDLSVLPQLSLQPSGLLCQFLLMLPFERVLQMVQISFSRDYPLE